MPTALENGTRAQAKRPYRETKGASPPSSWPNEIEFLGDERAFQKRLELLTARQREIILLICQGNPTKQIAWMLGITVPTVKSHATQAIKTLGANSKIEAAVKVSVFMERRKSTAV